MDFLLQYQWELFIAIEILFFVMVLLFGITRYLLNKRKISLLFLYSFVLLILLEAILALLLYKETGEISTFQIVIAIFVLYALTFGILDFMKMDRWMRKKIGNWRGMELLTEKDREIMDRNKDPKYLARKYRWTSTIHLVAFVIVQAIFWSYGTESMAEWPHYFQDLSWIESGTSENSPYPNDTVYGIGIIWSIVFVVDFIWSWSYTLFPSKK